MSDDEIAHCDRGIALAKLNRWSEALPSFERAIWLRPRYAVGHYYRGEALKNLGRLTEALLCYERAVKIVPQFLEAHNSRAYVLDNLGRPLEALAAYDRVLELRPTSVSALENCGKILQRLGRYQEAARRNKLVLEQVPDSPLVKGRLLHLNMLCCEWTGLESLIADIERYMDEGRVSVTPFDWQAVSNSPQVLRRCAEIYSQDSFPEQPAMHVVAPTVEKGKIRLGYVSGEFRDQATAHLLTGVLEHHDKSRFEVYIVDNGWDDGSDWRNRIVAASDAILSIRDIDNNTAARTVAAAEIDILINLNGFFGEDSTGLFARRPSPLQVNYLGFPGTIGARYMDYIIADHYVIPQVERRFYTEKVVHLPHCYQPNDNKKAIDEHSPTRAELGLPAYGFVFCCFNNTYKVTPETFKIWMRILGEVEGSVLWLLEVKAARDNLRREAAAHGIDPSRLIFAPRMKSPGHLARHRLADLFLDSLPYNAHTTASDALWAGLPVLTQTGKTFPGRVAGSLLRAIGLPELITDTPEAYEALAVGLARNPHKLAAIKKKLAENRLTKPLFDTASYTRDLEKAFEAMHSLYRAGRSPEHISA
jgi:predicted O-linked N-acetylglucosamine transferase (SPINDLY family)